MITSMYTGRTVVCEQPKRYPPQPMPKAADRRVSEAANDAREYWRQKVDYWKARAEAAEAVIADAIADMTDNRDNTVDESIKERMKAMAARKNGGDA